MKIIWEDNTTDQICLYRNLAGIQKDNKRPIDILISVKEIRDHKYSQSIGQLADYILHLVQAIQRSHLNVDS